MFRIQSNVVSMQCYGFINLAAFNLLNQSEKAFPPFWICTLVHFPFDLEDPFNSLSDIIDIMTNIDLLESGDFGDWIQTTKIPNEPVRRKAIFSN